MFTDDDASEFWLLFVPLALIASGVILTFLDPPWFGLVTDPRFIAYGFYIFVALWCVATTIYGLESWRSVQKSETSWSDEL